MDLHRLYDQYRDRTNFLTVYISEAHPADEWQMDSNVKDKIVFDQPKTNDERKAAAKILVEQLRYRIPVGLDPIDDRVGKAFAAWPERIYVVGAGGRILYKGGMGPFGFYPEEIEAPLAAYLRTRGETASASPPPS